MTAHPMAEILWSSEDNRLAEVGAITGGEYWRRIAPGLGLYTPEATLFVDDQPPNVVAAAALGLQAIHFSGYEVLIAALKQWGVV